MSFEKPSFPLLATVSKSERHEQIDNIIPIKNNTICGRIWFDFFVKIGKIYFEIRFTNVITFFSGIFSLILRIKIQKHDI